MSINPDLGLSDEQIERLVDLVGSKLRSTPRAWGDPSRISAGVGVKVCNALFNCYGGDIFLGDYTFFGHNVCLLTGTHDIRKKGLERQEEMPRTGRDIRIGKGVWLASNVTVIGPCTIGDHAVVAAGSVVCGGDLPGGYLYAGVPARSIKPIDFDDDVQEPLDDSRWTDL